MTPEQKARILQIQEWIDLADTARINALKMADSTLIIKEALESVLAGIRDEIKRK